MALERVNLSIDFDPNSTCDGLTFQDTTGSYNAVSNPEGYGLPNGIVVNDITAAEITLEYESESADITYAFTVASGVVTAATLSVAGATAVNILSELASTTFPFTSANPFDLAGDYGVTIPEQNDGLYQVVYTISGTSTGGGALPSQTFSYTTSIEQLITCATNCCISKMEADLDPNCGCHSEAFDKAVRARAYLNMAISAAEYGKTDEAKEALTKASSMCEGGCGCS